MAQYDIIANFEVKGLEDYKTQITGAAKATAELNKEEQTLIKNNQTLDQQADAQAADIRNRIAGIDSLRGKTKLYTEELFKMETAGLQNTQAFKNLQTEAGKFADRVGDLKTKIKNLGEEKNSIAGLVQGIGGLAGAFSIAQGAAALFGKENKQLQEALLKVNAAMAISNGLMQIQGLFLKESAFQTGVVAKAQKLWTLAIGESTGAMKILKIAIASTGIGLLILAAGALAANFDKVKAKIEETFPALGNLSKYFQQVKAIAAGVFDGFFAGAKGVVDVVQDLAKGEFKKAFQDLKAIPGEIAKAFTEAKAESLIEQNLVKKVKTDGTGVNVGKEIGKNIEKGIADQLSADNEDIVQALREIIEANEKNLIEIRKAGNAENIAAHKQMIEAMKQNEASLTAAIKAEQDKRNQDNKDALAYRLNAEKENRDKVLAAEAARTKLALDSFAAIGQIQQSAFSIGQVRIDREKAALDDQLAHKLISQKKYDRELAKLKAKQAKEDKAQAIFNAILNIAVGVTKAIAEGRLILAALVAALGAAEIGVIASQPIPKFAKGGEVKGKRHSEGGVRAELEGGEYVMKRDAVKKYGVNAMKKINQMEIPALNLPTNATQLQVQMVEKLILEKVSIEMKDMKDGLNALSSEMKWLNAYTKQGNDNTWMSANLLKEIATKKINGTRV